MRDAEQKLLRAIGEIDDRLVLEAATLQFKPKRWGHLIALAACVALVVAAPAFLSQNKGSPEAGLKEEAIAESAVHESAPMESVNDMIADATEGIDNERQFGPIGLGMPADQVQNLLGEPDSTEVGEYPVWQYAGLTITFHPFNDTVRTIDVRDGCALTLPTGIGMGSTQDAVAAAYTDGWMHENDRSEMVYEWNCLTIVISDGVVSSIHLADLSDPMLDALTVSEITLYQTDNSGWLTTKVIKKAAKMICTVLTISEPEAATAETSGTSLWMDFGNGTAVEVYGNDHAAVYTYEGTFDPTDTSNLNHYLSGVFLDLDEYVALALEDPTAGWN